MRPQVGLEACAREVMGMVLGVSNQTIRLGRIFGLEISCNWTLLLIFVLIAWTMASSVLPATAPGQSTLAYWVAGVAGTVIFYACLLAHEISHALMARRQGVRVAGITLWLFGGFTHLDGQPRTARAEALITVVGPTTSLVLAGLGFAIAVGLTALGAPTLITGLIGWLALLNLVLGIFNLVPALPLDGGRLLSSLLWWRTGSRSAGVHQAVRVGGFFAYLLIAGGVFEFLEGSLLNGIWLAFIGWFLISAGRSEDRQTQLLARIQGTRVSSTMVAPLIRIPDWLTVDQLLGSGSRQIPLYGLQDQSGQLSGFLSLADLAGLSPGARLQHRVSDFSIPASRLPTTTIGEDLGALLTRLGPAVTRGVLVLDGAQVVGVLNPSPSGMGPAPTPTPGWSWPA